MENKRMQTTEKVIGEAAFYIKPFAAFTAANISGDLAAILTPMLSAFAPLLIKSLGDGNAAENSMEANGAEESTNIMDMNVDKLMPSMVDAFSTLSGNKMERILKKLLTDNGNISVECYATEGRVRVLDYTLANEIFCGDLQDMFVLCFEVIKINFSGFFKKLAGRYGGLQEAIHRMIPTTGNMENSTQVSSAN